MLDIVGKRYYFFALSAVLILAGIIGMLVNGLELDIQFEGGTLIQMQMSDDNFDVAKAEKVVQDTVGKKATGQKLQTVDVKDQSKKINMLMLKVKKSEALNEDELNKVIAALEKEFNLKEDTQYDIQNVEPFIGKELLNKGILATVISSILITIYIWWRFSTMSGLAAAVMAIVALLHDTFIMLAVYALFRIPINDSFIAAVLTILGYSVNDTIVVYDRIRENTRLMKKTNTYELVNKSVLQTMTRSINTTVTVLISILIVYIFASVYNITSLKEFSMPLIVGTVSGSYSTIFIAGSLWAMWKERGKDKNAVKVAKAAR